jgi:hypothetical protein
MSFLSALEIIIFFFCAMYIHYFFVSQDLVILSCKFSGYGDSFCL